MQTGGGETQLECSRTHTRAQGYVNDDLRADELRKSWDFGSVPGMLTH